MFYNKRITVCDNANGYTDDSGIYHEGGEVTLDNIDCDIQPYSSDLLYRDYGFQEQVTKRIFCENTSIIAIGKKVKYLNDYYEIKRIIEWDDYMEFMIDNL